MTTATRSAFPVYAWGVLIYNVAVILWGAFVRATGSGAGCGQHWPLCNGSAVPQAPQLATVIEYTHRLSSGVALLLIVGLLVFAFRAFPARSLVRRAATAALLLTLSEGLIGAAIVLLGHVARDTSAGRGFTLSIHLINTLILVAAIAVTAWAGTAGARDLRWSRDRFTAAFALAIGAILLLGVSGAIAALGDTLFASSSLREGFGQDFAASSHPFVRLRIWHPAIATLTAIYLAGLSYAAVQRNHTARATRLAYAVGGILAVQLGVGMVNLVLRAPVPLQLIHLLLADLLWIAVVLLACEFLFAPRSAYAATGRNQPARTARPASRPPLPEAAG